MSPCTVILGSAPRYSSHSSFSERLPSSLPTTTNDGTDRAIHTASGDDSSPLGSRILSIADAYDAIRIPEVSSRIVRDKIALRIIRVAAGTQYAPELVDALWLFQESIPGSDLIEQRRETVLIHNSSTGGFACFLFTVATGSSHMSLEGHL